MNEKTNASQFPKAYYCRHMQPGTARYENETILVDTDGMRALINSGVGKPIYIDHQPVDLSKIKSEAVGYVSESFYNANDGWAWFKMIIIDDEAHEAIRKGWSVSNAYLPTEFGNGGTKNNVPYNREVRNGEFTHLAIVANPRYEGAMIYTPDEFKNYQEEQKKKNELQNSKPKGDAIMKLFNFKKEETNVISEDTMAELPDGTFVKVSEMINAVEKKAKAEAAEVVVNGKKVPLTELVNAYCKVNKKKNSKPEDEDDAEGEEEEVSKEDKEEGDDEIGDDKEKKAKKNKMKKNKKAMKNEDDMDDENMENEEDEDDKDDKKEKKNSVSVDLLSNKYFHELRNAHTKSVENSKPLIQLGDSQLERGKSSYGSAAIKK